MVFPAGAERSPRPGRAVRLRGAAVAVACWSVLGVAAVLRPHASGTGTHQELGLPSCSFLARTGLPCPTCGMTTSLSAMAHGQVLLAWQAQPFGVVLFLALAGFAVLATVESLGGRGVLAGLQGAGSKRPGITAWGLAGWLAWVVLLGIPAGWALKLIVGLADGSLPMR